MSSPSTIRNADRKLTYQSRSRGPCKRVGDLTAAGVVRRYADFDVASELLWIKVLHLDGVGSLRGLADDVVDQTIADFLCVRECRRARSRLGWPVQSATIACSTARRRDRRPYGLTKMGTS